MSRFVAVDYRDGKLGILDKTDNVEEYYNPERIKIFIKDGIVIDGVTLDEKLNPMYTINGLTVNLAYKNHNKFGKWVVALLRKGDKYGNTLSSSIKRDTVFFYDSSVNWSKQKYPFGQFVTSYDLKTIIMHNGSLVLDASVESWCVNAKDMRDIVLWLAKLLNKEGYSW